MLVGAARWIDRRDAEILLANCWGLTRSQLFARAGDSVPGDVVDCFGKAVTRRSEGVSVAYLLRRREFWSLTFEVSPAVLVPRPETELLVQRALELVRLPVAELADLGTGSGAIAIAVALSTTLVRAMDRVPREFFSPLNDSFLIGSLDFFSFMPGSKPPPWIMNPGMTRWKMTPSKNPSST